VDEHAFAAMDPEDVEVVREALVETGQAFEDTFEAGEDADWLGEFMETGSPEIDREERLGEVARLEGEIAGSQRRQQALRRYLDALGPEA
jgi:hypothetical protein